MFAKINAYVAMNKAKKDNLQMPFGMIDSKSLPEYFADLMAYAPSILD